jgi:hypothetical protein
MKADFSLGDGPTVPPKPGRLRPDEVPPEEELPARVLSSDQRARPRW